MLKKIIQYFATSSIKEKLFVVAIFGCGFFVSFDYGIIRPASHSIFIHAYGAEFFPYAWLAGVPVNLFLIYLYNSLLSRLGSLRTFGLCVVVIIIINIFSGLYIDKISWLPFAQNIFKDSYILLMYKQIWSLIHTTIAKKDAKFLYGWMFGAGGVGAMTGGIISGTLAVKLSSQALLFSSFPAYVFLFFFYNLAHKNSAISAIAPTQKSSASPKAREGFSLIRKSSVLTAIMLFVIFFQLMVAFTTYQFNLSVEAQIQDLDLRTQYTGRLFTLVHILMTFFQIFGSYFLIEKMGEKRSHYIIPVVFLFNAIFLVLIPTLFVTSYAFVFVKFFEFSFFGIIMEMLYIPLSLDEKFRAKAVIDVFVRRSAKALGAIALFVIPLIKFIKPHVLIGIITLPILISWISLVKSFFKPNKAEQLKIEN